MGSASGAFGPLSYKDVVIAVMGPSKTFRTKFISKCCNKTLNESKTEEITIHSFVEFERNIHLVDIPHFYHADSYYTLSNKLAVWLGTAYQQGMRFSGIIYLFPIGGFELSNAHSVSQCLFKICGKDAMPHTILASARHTKDVPMDVTIGETKIKEGFTVFLKNRAIRSSFDGGRTSAIRMIYLLLKIEVKLTFKIQHEMCMQNLPLSKTTLGQYLSGTLYKRLQAEQQARLLRIDKRIQVASNAWDQSLLHELYREQKAVKYEYTSLPLLSSRLEVTLEELVREQKAQQQRDRWEKDKVRQKALDEERKEKERVRKKRLVEKQEEEEKARKKLLVEKQKVKEQNQKAIAKCIDRLMAEQDERAAIRQYCRDALFAQRMPRSQHLRPSFPQGRILANPDDMRLIPRANFNDNLQDFSDDATDSRLIRNLLLLADAM